MTWIRLATITIGLGLACGTLFCIVTPRQIWFRTHNYYLLSSWTFREGCLVIQEDGQVVRSFRGGFCNFDANAGYFIFPNQFTMNFYNRFSELVWQTKLPFRIHHQATLDPKRKMIYVLSNEVSNYLGQPTLHNTVEKYDYNGKWLGRWSEFKSIAQLQSLLAPILGEKDRAQKTLPIHVRQKEWQEFGAVQDIFHFNSIQVIPKNDSPLPAFHEGNLLISCPRFGLFLILDPVNFEILWSYLRPQWEIDTGIKMQWMTQNKFPYGFNSHTVQILPSGMILLFANDSVQLEAGRDSGKIDPESHLMMIDPVQRKIVWDFKMKTESKFLYTVKGGSVELLPNGNYLASYGDEGLAFELTPDKKVVWSWRNPMLESNRPVPRSVYKVNRVTSEEFDVF